jgi:leader peptidase (prepilin peptidase)/N-methyltransferase
MVFEVLAWLTFLAFAVVLARIDVAEHRLPNVLVGTLAGLSLVLFAGAAAVQGDPMRLLRAVGTGSIVLASFLVLAILAPSGLGMGDVKLGFVTGAYLGWIGWEMVFWGTFLGFALGALWAVATVIRGGATRSTRIAFGPFLLLGVLVSAGVSVF